MSSVDHQLTSLTKAEKEFELCKLTARLQSMWQHAPKDESSEVYRQYVLKVRDDLVSFSCLLNHATSEAINVGTGIQACSSEESSDSLAADHLGEGRHLRSTQGQHGKFCEVMLEPHNRPQFISRVHSAVSEVT